MVETGNERPGAWLQSPVHGLLRLPERDFRRVKDDPNRRILSQEELERRLLHGLACEWERSLWVLDPPYRKHFRPPLFSLRDLNGRWGNWSGDRREISLSRRFVLNYSWASVREVLLHETAHQLAEEVLGGRQETPHGPIFRKACLLLRADPKASGNYQPLDDRVSRESFAPEDRILLRVRKLLALAGSPDRHEAEAAMAKAHKLIAKYNLDLVEGKKQPDYLSLLLGKPALRHFAEDYALANLLQDFYFVRGIWVSCYVPEKGRMGRSLEVSGTPSNVRIAGYAFDFVRRFIATKWAEYNRAKSLSRYRFTDFAAGIVEGFRSKMEPGEKSGKEEGGVRALVKKEDPMLKEYLAYRYPRLTTVQAGRGRQDPGIRGDGKRIGKELVISRGVMEGPGSRGFLLPS